GGAAPPGQRAGETGASGVRADQYRPGADRAALGPGPTPGAPVAPGAAASARASSTFRSDPLPSLAVGRAHDGLIHLDRVHEATRL
ncbi:hypothetical protein ACFWAO_32475, partial [Streptomyces sp. NPDC059981]